jgi:hypothetical protein
MVFEWVDLEQLGEKAVSDFTLGARSKARESAVNALVTKLEFTYAVAAKLAHREPTMEGTVAIWSKMVAICDQGARELQSDHQGSGATKASLDRILDLRNAAERRRALHE